MKYKVVATSTRILKPDETVELNSQGNSISIQGLKSRRTFKLESPEIEFRTKNGNTEMTLSGTLKDCQDANKSTTITLA